MNSLDTVVAAIESTKKVALTLAIFAVIGSMIFVVSRFFNKAYKSGL